jgi:hypothetical protein
MLHKAQIPTVNNKENQIPEQAVGNKNCFCTPPFLCKSECKVGHARLHREAVNVKTQ